MGKSIAVLIPCYNEALTVAKVVSDHRQALPEADIYVYDNNSTDNTVEEALKAGAIVRHEPRQGKGNVLRRMFSDIDADCYIIVDGDDTYPAESAREMAEQILERGVDMVIGDRLSSTYFTENKRRFHNAGNRLVRFLINVLFNSRINDIMTGYRAFSRKFVKGFPVMSRGFEIETEMTVHALDKNFVIKEIPVMYRDRPSGSFSKLNTFSDGMRVIRTITTLFKEYKPFVFFTSIALILAVVSVVMLVPVLAEYFQSGLVSRFPTLIVACFVLLTAILLWISGIILQVIAEKHKRLYELLLINVISKR